MGREGEVSDDYRQFLEAKAPAVTMRGFEPESMPDFMNGHQAHSTEFLLRCGSGGLYLDTGLGKSLCELEWCRQTGERSNGLSLLLTPLAVARQMQREAEKWGYDARVIRDQSEARPGINICNYDRLPLLDTQAFGSVAADEAAIIKNFSGKTTRALTDAFKHHRFKMPATATPAPNDHMELGTQAEFCGVMASNEMLSQFFINDTSTASQEWRLKKHAVEPFWDWMASWSRMAQMPSDLGFSDEGFVLPPLNIKSIQALDQSPVDGGDLLGHVLVSATDLHEIKRQTIEERAKECAGLVLSERGDPWVLWCDTNYEADALLNVLRGVPGVVEIRGSQTIDRKEDALEAFADGSARILITKPSLTGHGLNWQHCARTAFVGRSFSYEEWYQAVRRFWRFGQLRPVDCYVIVAHGEEQIGRVIDRKAVDHASMKRAMASAMRRAREKGAPRMTPYRPTHKTGLPSWIKLTA